jgi:hypothetical protein
MPKESKVSIRLTDNELPSLRGYAQRCSTTVSAAIRQLIADHVTKKSGWTVGLPPPPVQHEKTWW